MTRARFAPSPTGDLHVGGLRTALYNYLFARKTGGKFILRIEDTDRERHVPEAAQKLLETLHLCGLIPDEGPDFGGDFGPYVQSQRLHIYQEAAEKLLERGHAYPCFCSQERLNELRQTQRGKGETAGYDRHCRDLDRSAAGDRMKAENHVIRLAVPAEGEIKHNDVVWGEVNFPLADVDDQIIVKSDGFPTYHLANVVDDGMMNISHVIRGEEWLISVPKHLLLYQFLGLEPPQFAHLPLILNQDRQKLSKREGAGSVESWLARGILPQALINYIALLGWNPGDDREIFTLDELIDAFSIDRVNKSGSVFDPAKLEWTSGEHFKTTAASELIALSKPYLQETEFSVLSDDALEPLLDSVKKNLHSLNELPLKLKPFSKGKSQTEKDAVPWLQSEGAKTILPLILKAWNSLTEPDTDTMFSLINQTGKAAGVKGKDLWMPLRAAMTGSIAGPELRAIIAHIGPRETVTRLSKIVAELS